MTNHNPPFVFAENIAGFVWLADALMGIFGLRRVHG